jgi:NADH:ubiquinone oxidoreductase subunit 3 (subunit A)
MRELMTRFILVFSGVVIAVIMGVLSLFVHAEAGGEERVLRPLERGLATAGKVLTVLSVQRFFLLILFLVLDLEVVFIVRLV